MIYADFILKNGKIICIDPQNSIHQAVAIKFGKIIAVGSDSIIDEFTGKETNTIDLLGKIVVPGFIDSHAHFISEGSSKEIFVDLSEEVGIRS
ncbi:MAG: hypothetical protein ACFFE4_08445, partial [Candidatus Thorarchaeota archaeon]